MNSSHLSNYKVRAKRTFCVILSAMTDKKCHF